MKGRRLRDWGSGISHRGRPKGGSNYLDQLLLLKKTYLSYHLLIIKQLSFRMWSFCFCSSNSMVKIPFMENVDEYRKGDGAERA